MRIIISPAKKMRVDTDSLPIQALPDFLPETERLLVALRTMTPRELQAMWKCSDSIAALNVERLATMDLRRRLTPAILSYEGIQYQYMAPGVFEAGQYDFIQEHLRIVSGFYGLLRPYISQNAEDVEAEATSYGIGWAASSGEAKAVCPDNSLVVDGIENCSRVLEEIENNKLSDLVFFEGNACTGGCVGGPLTFENNYVAKNAIRKLVDNARQQRPERPAQSVPASMMTKYPLYMDAPILPNSAIQLDSDITVALDKMERINQILQDLPGYDCGSCGSPTCRTFAEDIVCGYCNEMFCIHKLKDRLKVMAQQMVELAQMKRE